MQIDIGSIGSDEVLFHVDPEGISVENFIEVLRRAAADQFDADVQFAPQGKGWIVFGDGSEYSFALTFEVVAGAVIVTPLYFDQSGEDVPAEDMVLLLHHANLMLAEPAEVDAILDEILLDMTPRPRVVDIDELTGLEDDDGITVEIDFSDIEVEGGIEYTLEGLGGQLKLTPPPQPLDTFDF